MDDLSHRKRQQLKARRTRWRRRQAKGMYVVDVLVSARFLSYLAQTEQISEADLAADDRSADGPVAQRLARLAEQAVCDWGARTGRIVTEDLGPPSEPPRPLPRGE